MATIRRAWFAILMLALAASDASAETRILRMDWDEFARRATGKRIAVVFSTPPCDVEALVTKVEPEAVVLQTVKTSDPAVTCPKGTRLVPRREVKTVRLLGVKGPAVGLAILGGVGGYVAAVAGTFAKGDEFSVSGGHVALFSVAAVGGAAAGYYLGKQVSRDVTIIIE